MSSPLRGTPCRPLSLDDRLVVKTRDAQGDAAPSLTTSIPLICGNPPGPWRAVDEICVDDDDFGIGIVEQVAQLVFPIRS